MTDRTRRLRFPEFGVANEEHVNLISVDRVNQDVHCDRDQEPSVGIKHPALDLADRRPPRGQRPGV